MAYRIVGRSKHKLYFGVELEVECTGNETERVSIRSSCSRRWRKYIHDCGDDGSLNYGIEFRLHPATLNQLCNTKFIDAWLKYLNKCKVRSWDTSTCGMHVHINRTAFTADHAQRFFKFFYGNPNFIRHVARRSGNTVYHWSHPRAYKPSDWERMGGSETRWPRDGGYKKYSSCYLHDSCKTIEIRIFRGTLSPTAFKANIKFLHALYYFTKHTTKEENTLKNFLLWIKEKKQYTSAYNLCTIKQSRFKEAAAKEA